MGEYNFLNDITKFGNNALSAANTLQRQVRSWVTEQVEYLIKSMELITQDELNEAMSSRDAKIDALEKAIAALKDAEPSHAAAPIKKPVTEKAVTEKAVTEKPVTEKPVTEKAVTKKPAKKKPVAKKAQA